MDNEDTQRLLGELHANSTYTKEKLDAIQERLTATETKVSFLYNELSVYKTGIKLLRAVLVSVVFILSFKFGDLHSYWTNVFSGK